MTNNSIEIDMKIRSTELMKNNDKAGFIEKVL